MSDDFSLPQLGDHDTDYAAGSIRDAPTTPKTAADLEQLFDRPLPVEARAVLSQQCGLAAPSCPNSTNAPGARATQLSTVPYGTRVRRTGMALRRVHYCNTYRTSYM